MRSRSKISAVVLASIAGAGLGVTTPAIPAAAASTITVHTLTNDANVRMASRDGSRVVAFGDITDVDSGASVSPPFGYVVRALDATGARYLATRADGVLVRRSMASNTEVIVPVPTAGAQIDPNSLILSADASVVAYGVSKGNGHDALAVTGMTGTPMQASVSLPATATNSGPIDLSMSPDGRFVSFIWGNYAAGCTVAGTGCDFSVQRYDRVAGSVTRVDVDPAGQPSAAFAAFTAISNDGRFVAFASESTTLVPGLSHAHARVFMRDMLAGVTRLVSDTHFSDASSVELSMSGDAHRVAFTDIGQVDDGVVRYGTVVRLADLTDGTVSHINAVGGGLPGGDLDTPIMNEAGDRLLFAGNAPNIVAPAAPSANKFWAEVGPAVSPTATLVFSSGDMVDPAALVSSTPTRLLDTRAGNQIGYVGAKPSAAQIVPVSVPAGIGAAVLNVTGLDASSAGFVTVFPCGEAVPTASNLNLMPGVASPNLVISKVGANGKVCLFTDQSAHLIVDLSGVFPVGVSYVPSTPTRILDTRPAGPVGYSGAKPTADQVVKLALPNAPGAVVLNVTGLDADVAGFVTVYPCGSTIPNTSNLNLVPGVASPNLVVAKTSSGVCVSTGPSAHLIVDVLGTIPPDQGYSPLAPSRVLDTRPSGLIGYAGAKPTAGQTVEVTVPAGVAAAVLNITGLDADAAGFVTVYPCGQPVPNASNLNLVPGVASPNLAISKVGSNAKVCVFTNTSAHLLADLVGTFA